SLCRQLLHRVHELHVGIEVFALEARMALAAVARAVLVGTLRVPGEEAAAERALGDESDAELPARRQDLGLDLALPERVLGLQRADGMDGVPAAQSARTRFRQADEPDLAGAHQIGHRTHG